MEKPQNTFWDNRAKHYDKEIRQHDSAYQKTLRATRALLRPDDTVLEFGCASGESGLDLAANVCQYTGIDTSEKMIALANQKAGERQIGNINFHHTDLFDSILRSNSFSVILAFNVFHLLDNIPKNLKRIHELLVPDGRLISQTPCLSERGFLFRNLINFAQKSGLVPPIQNLTTVDLESLISTNNFEISESRIWDKKNAVHLITAIKIT